MAQISLGQIFIMRRDLKNEIVEIDSMITNLAYYREDRIPPEEDYNIVFDTLTHKRDQLLNLDMVIEKANSMPDTITFKDNKMTLNMARHTKVHFNAVLIFLMNQARLIEPQTRREDKETETDYTLNPPTNKIVKYKYTVKADIKGIKEQIKEVQNSVRQLDALIQAEDWSLMVEDPS